MAKQDTGRTVGIIILVIAVIYIAAGAVVYHQTGAWSWTPWTHIAQMVR